MHNIIIIIGTHEKIEMARNNKAYPDMKFC